MISEHCFDGCGGLQEITIPNSVTSVGDSAFKDCGSLARVTFEGLRTQWDAIEFGVENEALTEATVQCQSTISGEWGALTWTLTNDGDCSLSPATGTMADFTEEAPNAAWRPFTGIIQSVEFGDDVTSIGSLAFSNCSALNTITIPDSIVSIGKAVLSGCIGLENIVLSENSVPLLTKCLAGCRHWAQLNPDGVTTVGERAFLNCSGLNEVTIPDTVTSIGSGAFEGCGSLNAIDLPDGLTRIEEGTFKTSGLTEIVIPEGVTSIGSQAFQNCQSLARITLPVSVSEIGAYAFNDCGSLTEVIYTGIPVQWEDISIAEGNWQLEWASRQCVGTVTDSWGDLSWTLDSDGLLTVSGDGAINPIPAGEEETAAWRRYASSIRNVLLEEGISSIGTRAFMNCTALESANLPESLSSINAFAFSNCTGLNTIRDPGCGQLYRQQRL